MQDQFKNDPLLKELWKGFVSRLPESTREIKQAAQKGDWDNVILLAHRLKGTAGCYGVPLVSKCADKLERLTIANTADLRILPLIEDLQTLVLSLAAGRI